MVQLVIMEDYSPVRLDLRAPLVYAEAHGLDPFNPAIAGDSAMGEYMFYFELDPKQAGCIEPEAGCLLGGLVFSGQLAEEGKPLLAIPAGLYLFAQQRRVLCREECIELAIELQKDGLWERLQLESRLYIRRLFEDGSAVTQLFRPY